MTMCDRVHLPRTQPEPRREVIEELVSRPVQCSSVRVGCPSPAAIGAQVDRNALSDARFVEAEEFAPTAARGALDLIGEPYAVEADRALRTTECGSAPTGRTRSSAAYRTGR